MLLLNYDSMPNFDVSFLNPSLRKSGSQDYGFLVDQLSIKESQLKGDGKLSPGDYDILISEAQKMYSHPGLSAAQRSNIEVKLAGYSSSKSSNSANDLSDTARLQREVSDEMTKVGLNFSNDPTKFLTAKAAVLNASIDRLSDSINQLDAAGDDSSNQMNDLNVALNDYNDTLQALEDSRNYGGSGAPTSNYAAYVVTNADGEVVDLKVARVGAQSGYLETNGVYGGLPLYGKLNRKDVGGKNVFVLGNKTYQGADYLVPGPDGTMKPTVLTDTATQKGGGFTQGVSTYNPVDLNAVRSQSAIRAKGWVEGSNGFFYQKQDDGSYKKFTNLKDSQKEWLGITPNTAIRVPRAFEDGIIKSTTETVDGTISPLSPLPQTLEPNGTAGAETVTPAAGAQPALAGAGTNEPAPAGEPSTPGPIVRAAKTAAGVAGSAVKAAGSFLGSLFGQ